MAQKPKFHFVAPHGWMNDPCGPGYDASTGQYHLFFQWNAKSCEWGDISWGHATSDNLVMWDYASFSNPVLSPDEKYDKKGVFTGCLLPQGLRGEPDRLTLFYTSVCHLPIHWTIPYVRASEGLAAAISVDGGRTWRKASQNPILREEPVGVDVTGWRDPYVAPWDGADCIRGEKSLYGVISGGIRDQGPTSFLYSVAPDDLSQWDYLGTLLDLPKNYRPSRKWSGDFGANLECTNFMTLEAHDGKTRDFAITGSEGGVEREWVTTYLSQQSETLPRRTTRYCLWLSGSLEKAADGINMRSEFDGILDHGCFYAANSFHDPRTRTRVVWGWLPEEDVPLEYCKAKGWNGTMGLPRELFLLKIHGVTGGLHSRLDQIKSLHFEAHGNNGSSVVETLGIRPLPVLETLCDTKPHVLFPAQLPTLDSSTVLTPIRGSHWKMEATVSIGQGCSEAGFHILHSQDMSTKTSIIFSPADEEIVVDRSKSNDLADINKCEERGPFTLFILSNPKGTEQEEWRVTIFCDGGVIEVYANDRFVLSTMVYVLDPEAVGVSLFSKGSFGAASFREVKFWDNMKSIFRA